MKPTFKLFLPNRGDQRWGGGVQLSRACRPAEGGERECTFRTTLTEGEMMAVAKKQTSCALHVDLLEVVKIAGRW